VILLGRTEKWASYHKLKNETVLLLQLSFLVYRKFNFLDSEFNPETIKILSSKNFDGSKKYKKN